MSLQEGMIGLLLDGVRDWVGNMTRLHFGSMWHMARN
jgi:hypothetical protein